MANEGGFLPGACRSTFAQAADLGRGPGMRSRPRKRRGKKRAAVARKRKRNGGKPRPGTKAWMSYIRGKRGKKKR